VCWPLCAWGELYTYVDKHGVVHFTNIHPKRRVASDPGKSNTYAWEDGAGHVQRLHRVGVNTYDAVIEEAAAYYSLPRELVKAVVAAESSFEPKALSPAGAVGLMQLLPSTAKDMFVGNIWDPKENIWGGTRYLRILANRFDGDIRLTVAGYNAGPEAVSRAGGVPHIEETRLYVQRVLAYYRCYLKAWSKPQ
jgi:soluble lytic murein transglycosylase-like protein